MLTKAVISARTKLGSLLLTLVTELYILTDIDKQTMSRECKNCGKEFEAKTKRAEFCGAACRKAFGRNNGVSRNVDVTQTVTENVVTQSSVTTPVNTPRTYSDGTPLNKTDGLFQKDAEERLLGGDGKDWLIFGNEVRGPECNNCHQKFKTRLQFLNYCSPECRRTDLRFSK